MRSAARKTLPTRAPTGAVHPATVAALGPDADRVLLHAPGAAPTPALLALAVPYRPTPGDRVLVAEGDGEAYVIGVLQAARPAALALPDGATVEVTDGAAELRDPEGRLLVRYAEGRAEIAAPAGDLVLRAPGRIELHGGEAVEISAAAAAPQLRIDPATTRLQAERIEVRAADHELTADRATVLAGHLATTAGSIVERVERLEVTAGRLIERTRDAFRETTDLAQTRAGRVRTLVEGAYALWSRRTTMASTDETSIDGSKVLLG